MVDRIVITIPGDPIAKNMPTIGSFGHAKCRACGKPKGPPKMFVPKWRERKRVLQGHIMRGLLEADVPTGEFPFRFVRCEIEAWYAGPQKKGQAGFRIRNPFVAQPKPSKPDLDRIINATLDALTDLVYKDDAVVTSIRAVKRITAQGVPGFTKIILTEDREECS